MISPVLPHAQMDNAGGTYVQALHEALAPAFDVAFVCPDVPVNRRSADADGHPERFLLVGHARGGFHERGALALTHRLAAVVARLDVTAPPLPFALGLLLSPEARTLIRNADVIDVQWSELIRLAPLLRRLNRRAALVGTFHDVLSQRYRRYAAARERSLPTWAWRLAGAIAARSERAAQRRLSLVLTFSDKDRALLLAHRPRYGAPIEVVDPPLHAGPVPPRQPSADPTVVFVGSLSRDDNIDAVEWLLGDVWPRIRREVPAARLRVIGSKPHERVRAAVAAASGTELTGFVDDLAAVYASAWVTVIPLRLGAGVKFKTIESLVAGVPVVSTEVGAEGIGDAGLFATVADGAGDFATGVVSVLRDPEPAERRAERSAAWAREKYAVDRFVRDVAPRYAELSRTVRAGR